MGAFGEERYVTGKLPTPVVEAGIPREVRAPKPGVCGRH